MNRDARDILGLSATLEPDAHRRLLNRALNAAVLLCEQNTVMPPGFFLECELAYEVVSHKTQLIDAGLIILPRRELSLERLVEKKRSQYASVRHKFEGLFDDRKVRIFSESQPLFIKRATKIGATATRNWEEGPDLEVKWDALKAILSPSAIENARSAPRILLENGEALTWAALKPHLDPEVLHHEVAVRLFLQRNYFTLYVDEFELVVLNDIPHFVDDFCLPSPDHQYSFSYLRTALAQLGILWFLDVSATTLARLKGNPKMVRFIDSYVQIATIAGSPGNMAALLERSLDRTPLPQVIPIDASSLIPEVSILESDERALTDALGDVADDLTREHGLYVRAPVNATADSGTFEPWRNPLAVRDSGRRGSRTRAVKNVVLATANGRETAAVLHAVEAHLHKSEPIFVGRETFVPRWSVELPTKHGKVSLSIAQADETGGDEAVDLLRRVVAEVKPDAVFFVGCAALLDEKEKPRPNLVYLARRGIDADKGQLSAGEHYYDMEQHPGDLLVRRTLTNLAANGVFDPVQLVLNRDFISGSVFLGDRNADRRRDLVTKFPGDAVVLEMEAFQVYKELYRMRSVGVAPSVSVVKGISDVGDEDAQVNKAETQRIATTNAANVVITFLVETAG